ncbi:MAG: hypothetical protein H7232_09620 [Aeromicrobium sp.]|nr:hypothetical protein [Burkholderiales bacterium]
MADLFGGGIAGSHGGSGMSAIGGPLRVGELHASPANGTDALIVLRQPPGWPLYFASAVPTGAIFLNFFFIAKLFVAPERASVAATSP